MKGPSFANTFRIILLPSIPETLNNQHICLARIAHIPETFKVCDGPVQTEIVRLSQCDYVKTEHDAI